MHRQKMESIINPTITRFFGILGNAPEHDMAASVSAKDQSQLVP